MVPYRLYVVWFGVEPFMDLYARVCVCVFYSRVKEQDSCEFIGAIGGKCRFLSQLGRTPRGTL